MKRLPHLLITRPAPDGQAFGDAVARAMGRDIPVILSPAFVFEPLQPKVPKQVPHVIFTSAQGVAQAVRLGIEAQTAWCVGDKTAGAARQAGYDVHSAGGAADDLVRLLIDASPEGPMLHVAGEQATGDVASRLRDYGFDCAVAVAYRQDPRPPVAAAIAAASQDHPVVAPCFSARSAAPLLQLDWRAPLHCVAISPAVAEALAGLAPETMRIAQKPVGIEMIESTIAALGALIDRCVP